MPSANTLKYICVRARQSDDHQVLSFAARAADILRFASIERIGRGTQGELSGFQRRQFGIVKTDIRKNTKPTPLLDTMEH